jgi:hypothetical protein
MGDSLSMVASPVQHSWIAVVTVLVASISYAVEIRLLPKTVIRDQYLLGAHGHSYGIIDSKYPVLWS